MSEKNEFLSRMEYRKNWKLKSCSDDIKPLIDDFYNKCAASKINWDESPVALEIERLFEAAIYFAENTTKGEIIEGEDLISIKGIMKELEKLYEETLNSSLADNDYYSSKINLISEIFCKNILYMKYGYKDENNIHKGKIFQRYKDLYLVINLVNEHYDELSEKGFSLDSIWYPFWEVTHTNSFSEDEKMEAFLGLINGTMRFQPVYERKAIGYTIKPTDFNEEIVKNISTRYDKYRGLIQTDEIFEIDGKGTQQKIIKKQI